MAGLYFHIPFCKQACYYCDFHFSTDSSNRGEIIQAMARELALQSRYLDETFTTLYFGGGTPSLLTPEELGVLFAAAHRHVSVSAGEITLEANPDDLTRDNARALRQAGFNRLSIGIQSFEDALLQFLNRSHSAETSRQCIRDVREAGFDNISIDLIYAIPGLDQSLWRKTLEEAIQFAPEHISAYALTIENKTVFGNWLKRGKFMPMEESDAASQFEILMNVLEQAGYTQYEISNFSKPGFEARHNSSYWNQSHYLGIGPGAHSYNGISRQFNVRNNALYIRSLQEGKIPFEIEALTPANMINEYILTSLRTSHGCNLDHLKTELKDDLLSRSGDYVDKLTQEGLVILSEGILKLTRKGRLLADKISEDLMISA